MQSFAFTDIYCTRKWGAIHLVVSSFEIWRTFLYILFLPLWWCTLSFQFLSCSFCFWMRLQRKHIDWKWIFFSLQKTIANFLAHKIYSKTERKRMESKWNLRMVGVLYCHFSCEKIDSHDWAERIWLACNLFDVTFHCTVEVSAPQQRNSTNKVISIKRIEPWNLLFTISLELCLHSTNFLSLLLPIFNNQSNVIIFISIRSLECNFFRAVALSSSMCYVRMSGLMRTKFDNEIR